MKTSKIIENGVIKLSIQGEISVENFNAILDYIQSGESEHINGAICFRNGDSEEWYENLMDRTDKFSFSDCEVMYWLEILTASSVNGHSFYSIADGVDEETLKMIRREFNIDSIVNE